MCSRCVMTFTKTADTLTVYDRARALFQSAVLIPVPHQISKSCGLAIEFPSAVPEGAVAAFRQALPCCTYLYRLELERHVSGALRVRDVTEL